VEFGGWVNAKARERGVEVLERTSSLHGPFAAARILSDSQIDECIRLLAAARGVRARQFARGTAMMASLQVLKGPNQGEKVTLDETNIIGRDPPKCNIVIPMNAVSREHAKIVRVGGRYYIEDLKSRNHTYVNNEVVETRVLLRNNDKIRICDFLAAFQDDSPLPPLPRELVPTADDDEDGSDGSTTVEATLSHGTNLQLEMQPAEKLKAILEISRNLSRTLELDHLLPRIVDSLFLLFKQADRCFIILAEEAISRGGEGIVKLIPKVIKTRRPQDETSARFSRTIVKKCLDTGDAFLSDDASGGVPLSQSVVDFRIRSVLCAPLSSAEGKAFGVIQLDTQDRNKKFTQDDLKLLQGVANQASIAMENAKLHEGTVVRERLRRDLELAHQMQLSFLPSRLPEVTGYEFFSHYEPALEVGGDYYDFIKLGTQRLAVLVGDVAGKGVPAALLMAKLSSDARFFLLSEKDPAQAITKLNNQVYQHTSQMDRFVTLVAAVLDQETNTVTLINAGHPSPRLHRIADKTLSQAMPNDAVGEPLGIFENKEYSSCQIQLGQGDSLLMFSDGVLDSFNVRGRAFSFSGIQTAINDGEVIQPQAAGARIVEALKRHSAGRSQHDDITLVCFGRIGN
jgi:sigma-B regulation protein RsbU (phosphoserine phosphatase)